MKYCIRIICFICIICIFIVKYNATPDKTVSFDIGKMENDTLVSSNIDFYDNIDKINISNEFTRTNIRYIVEYLDVATNGLSKAEMRNRYYEILIDSFINKNNPDTKIIIFVDKIL